MPRTHSSRSSTTTHVPDPSRAAHADMGHAQAVAPAMPLMRATDILSLQRTIGNRAVQRMLAEQHLASATSPLQRKVNNLATRLQQRKNKGKIYWQVNQAIAAYNLMTDTPTNAKEPQQPFSNQLEQLNAILNMIGEWTTKHGSSTKDRDKKIKQEFQALAIEADAEQRAIRNQLNAALFGADAGIDSELKPQLLANAGNEAQAFRGNTDVTKYLKVYTLDVGRNFFDKVIMPQLAKISSSRQITKISGSDTMMDDDSSHIIAVYNDLMDTITGDKAWQSVSGDLKRLCYKTYKQMQDTGASDNGAFDMVSSMIFLRVINPMFVDLLSKSSNETLMVISKILQNQANKTVFREQKMLVFNDLLDQYKDQMSGFVNRLIQEGQTLEAPVVRTPPPVPSRARRGAIVGGHSGGE